MPYEPTVWQDRIVERPRTFTVTNNPDGTITLTPSPGIVVQEGTPVNAASLNKMEQGIWEALFASSDLPWGGITRIPTYDPVTGDITQSDEVITATGTLLRRRTYTYTYTGEDLTTINITVYDGDGVTVVGEVTDTLNYNGSGDWTGTTRVVNV